MCGEGGGGGPIFFDFGVCRVGALYGGMMLPLSLLSLGIFLLFGSLLVLLIISWGGLLFLCKERSNKTELLHLLLHRSS